MKEKNNLTLNYIAVQVGMWAMYAPLMGYTSVFLLAKGFSNTEIGTVSAAGCIVSVILQAIISGYADKEKSKSVKTLLIMIVSFQFVLAGILLVLSDTFALVIGIIFGTLIAVMQLMVPLTNSLAMEMMNQGKKINYGAARGTASLTYAILVNTIGVFVKGDDLSIVPIAAMLSAAVLFLGTVLFPFKRAARNTEVEIKSKTDTRAFLIKYPKVSLFVAGAICAYVGHNLINIFLFQIVTLKGGNYMNMGLCLSLAAMFEIPVMFGFAYMILKRDSSFWVRVGSLGIMFKIIFTLFVPNIANLYVVQVCQIFGFATFVVATVYYANQVVEESDRVKGQAYMTMANTLSIVFASVLGGVLIDLYGTNKMMIAGSVIAVAGCVMIFVSTVKSVGNKRKR
nr:MFS transporter [uncultured Catonella sp.]